MNRYFEIIPVELPGRGNRSREKLLIDFEEAARDIQQQITNRLAAWPFLIFGHSMGSYIGLKVTNELVKIGQYPTCLIVSGSSGPKVCTERTSLLSQQEFIHKVQTLGGTPPGLLENEELVEYLEPILRADFGFGSWRSSGNLLISNCTVRSSPLR